MAIGSSFSPFILFDCLSQKWRVDTQTVEDEYNSIKKCIGRGWAALGIISSRVVLLRLQVYIYEVVMIG